MGKMVTLIVGLVAGAIGGTVVGGSLIGGATTGVGIATGMSAGICSTVQAAREEGLLTAEQVDLVLTRAAADLSEMSGDDGSGKIVVGSDGCDTVMQELRAAAD